MKVIRTTPLGLIAFVAFVGGGAWACNSGGDDAGASSSSSSSGGGPGDEDERGSVGPAHPAFKYCTDRGGQIDNAKDLCVFPDGTACPPMRFWYGQCGQTHSYCEEHGGKLTSTERDMGGWTAIIPVCTLGGKECDEHEFIRTGKCP